MQSSSNAATSTVDQYLRERDAFIQEDRALRIDSLRTTTSDGVALKAEEIVRTIRAQEAQTVWRAEYSSIPHPFPGMEFLTGRSIIIQTSLFQILLKMPKGALLHAHLDATVNVDYLLKLALDQAAIHVRAPRAIDTTTIKTTLPEFSPLPQDQFSQVSSLTDSSYSPDSWVPIRQARATFSAALGGPDGFDHWVKSAMTINPTEAYQTHNTVEKIWQKFASTFITSTGLIRFSPIWTQYIREFFLTSIEDGISYIEARINFLFKYMYGPDGHENMSHREWVLIFEKVQIEVKEEMKKQGRENEFVGAKIIYTTIRHLTPEDLQWYLDDCISLKQEFPHIIAGFDLVGNENLLRPLIYYAEPLLRFRKRVEELGLDIPFIFHAGETLGDGTEADLNLYDAILLGTKRIGHGFSLVKHPKLMQICRERGIPIEVCPISNEILRLTSSMPMHPLPILINNGIPVALCSDDPAVFGNMGLSFDYYQVIAASEITGLITLGEIARASLEHSCLEDKEKQTAIACWEKRWREFLQDVANLDMKDPPAIAERN